MVDAHTLVASEIGSSGITKAAAMAFLACCNSVGVKAKVVFSRRAVRNSGTAKYTQDSTFGKNMSPVKAAP